VDSETYGTFIQHVKEINTLRSIQALLEWDQETYMPQRAAEDRGNQLAVVAGVLHEKLTTDELGGLLGKLEQEVDGEDYAVATNLREVRREHDRAVKVPTDLVKRIAKATALARDAWVPARKDADFPRFAPHLEHLLELKREVADRIGWDSEPYDALMDEFEPGARAAVVQEVFDKVKAELVPLVAAIKNAPRQPDTSILERACPPDKQAAFNRRIAEAMGFDFEAGRVDVSVHPFCSGHSPKDVRFTTRYDEHYVPMSLFGVMHETGHALYEQGFDAKHTGTPMAIHTSLGIHESQSRLWENQVGRSRLFWEHVRLLPHLRTGESVRGAVLRGSATGRPGTGSADRPRRAATATRVAAREHPSTRQALPGARAGQGRHRRGTLAQAVHRLPERQVPPAVRAVTRPRSERAGRRTELKDTIVALGSSDDIGKLMALTVAEG